MTLETINRIILPVLRRVLPLSDRLLRWLGLMEPAAPVPPPDRRYKVLLRRGVLGDHPAFIPAAGEPVFDTAEKKLYIGTGHTDPRVVPYRKGRLWHNRIPRVTVPPTLVLDLGEAVYVEPLDRMVVGDGVTPGGILQGDPV